MTDIFTRFISSVSRKVFVIAAVGLNLLVIDLVQQESL